MNFTNNYFVEKIPSESMSTFITPCFHIYEKDLKDPKIKKRNDTVTIVVQNFAFKPSLLQYTNRWVIRWLMAEPLEDATYADQAPQ